MPCGVLSTSNPNYSFLTVFPNEMDANKIFMQRLEQWITFDKETET